jgi:tetratricopeptide (TPR) repeat protein
MMTKIPLLRILLGFALLSSALGVSAVGAADSFYLDLLRQGTRNAQAGKFPDAVQKLRIACFGFLDDPKLLARGLVRLALAEAATGNRVGFQDTFDRLAMTEERFGAYSAAEIPDVERNHFQKQAIDWIPDGDLLRIPIFEKLLVQVEQSELAGLPVRQMRSTLQQRLQSDEDNTEYLWRLAELEWREGKVRQAAPLVDRLLALEPANGQALCLRGLIGENKRDCGAAIAGLPLCAELESNTVLAGFLLECLARAEQWDAAHRVTSTLDPEVLGNVRISQLISELPENETAPDDTPEIAAGFVVATEAATEPSETSNSEGLAAVDSSRLEHARELLLRASQLDDLEASRLIATQLLDSYPDSQKVRFFAAEVAYRGSQWSEAVSHFEHLAPPTPDQTLLVFYYAVSLYENGDRDASIPVLESALALIERTPFVDSYANRILQPETVSE